jgi:hypothetical protein
VTARGERKLQLALSDLVAALEPTGVHWMIIGGIAVIARGVQRFTADIDAAVRGDDIDVDALVRALAKRKIVPRIDRAEDFARANLVLLLRHEPSNVELDVSFAWTDFEHEAIAAATDANFASVRAPMARPEDLVVFKSIAGRGKDVDDVIALLTLYPKLKHADLRARVQQLAALADAPELAQSLEVAISAAAATARSSKPTRAATAAKAKPTTPKSKTKNKRPSRKQTSPKPRK